MIVIAPDVCVPRGMLPRRELATFLRDARKAIPLPGSVAVLLTNDSAVQELNLRFRRKNQATDVLSFPSAPPGGHSRAGFAGDLAISLDTAARQAAVLGHSLLPEVKILLLHGLLHLAGYDHEQDSGTMARREHTLRRRFGLPAGLIQRAAIPASPVRASR